MNTLNPNQDCPLSCAHRNGHLCVCNLIAISGENTPISLGLRIGLNHVYEDTPMPPCLHGDLGSTYWSTERSHAPDGTSLAFA